MNIVVAPDSFKGSLTAMEAAKQMEKGIRAVFPKAEVVLKPMADGGEGTLDSLTIGTDSTAIHLPLTGPLGRTLSTTYRILPSNTAIIETASIAGLTQVPKEKRNPDKTTSYGLGEAIIDALDRGCERIIIGLGGSATNDGGLGMLQALGMKAFDTQEALVGMYGKDVATIARVDMSGLDPRLAQTPITIASDVTNPLYGSNGASVVYGPQKGATSDQIAAYDKAFQTYSALIEQHVHRSFHNQAGAGAAGGLGFALLAIGAEMAPGAAWIGQAMNLEAVIQSADLVITGEGKSDAQTLDGKAPGYVASVANKHNIPILLIAGSIAREADRLREHFAGCFSILQAPMSLETAMNEAGTLLWKQTIQVCHLVKQLSHSH